MFSSRIVSVFTGLAFLLMMTRTLSTQQFGLWEVILDIVTFASYPAGVVVFWATRDIARGRLLGRTTIWLNMALSGGGLGLYALFSLFVSTALKGGVTTLVIAAVLVPIGYWNQAANAVVSGHRPIVAGYAVIASEASKLLVAFPLLVVLRVGVDGVVVSILVANTVQAAVSTVLTRDASALPVEPERAKRWISQAWLPSLTTLPYVLGVADTFLASLASGGTTLVGYYQAAFTVATVAGYAYYLAVALYPLLLRGGSHDVVARSVDLTLLLGIPMAVGAATLARPILLLLRPSGTYLEASTALAILSFSALVNAVSIVLDQTLMGKERVDADEASGFRNYVRSNIFFVSMIDLATALSYLLSIFVVIYTGTRAGAPVPEILDEWALVQLTVFSVYAAIKLVRVHRGGRVVAARSLAVYVGTSALMGAFLWLAGQGLRKDAGTIHYALEFGAIGIAGVLLYFGVVYLADDQFKGLVKAFLRRRIGGSAP